MNSIFRILAICMVITVGTVSFIPQSFALKSIAKISGFEGDSIILSGKEFIQVAEKGKPLKAGDFLQTKQGAVDVIFNDGAELKIRPYTNVMIQEQDEKSGWSIFKKKRMVRRIICYVGTLWFKSGAPETENCINTPSAACGLKGTTIEFQYNPEKDMAKVKIIEGQIVRCGNIEIVDGLPEIGKDIFKSSLLVRTFEKAKRTKADVDALNVVNIGLELIFNNLCLDKGAKEGFAQIQKELAGIEAYEEPEPTYAATAIPFQNQMTTEEDKYRTEKDKGRTEVSPSQ